MQTSKQAKKALDTFSARGSKCPICHVSDFRRGCEHSIQQAKDILFERYIKALALEVK